MNEYYSQQFTCTIPMEAQQQNETIEALEYFATGPAWDRLDEAKGLKGRMLRFEKMFPNARELRNIQAVSLAIQLFRTFAEAGIQNPEALETLHAQPLGRKELYIRAGEDSDPAEGLDIEDIVTLCRFVQNRFDLPPFGIQWSMRAISHGGEEHGGEEHGGGAVAILPGRDPVYHSTREWLDKQLGQAQKHARPTPTSVLTEEITP